MKTEIINKITEKINRVTHTFTKDDRSGFYISDKDVNIQRHLKSFIGKKCNITSVIFKTNDFIKGNVKFEIGNVYAGDIIKSIGFSDEGKILLYTGVDVFIELSDAVRHINELKFPEPKKVLVKKVIEPIVKPKVNMYDNILLQINKDYLQPIRLEKTLKNRGKQTLERFLINFFNDYNLSRNTIYSTTKKVQTEMGKRRSLGDIYMICKYYFPNCTVQEVYKLLTGVLPNYFVNGFRTSSCKMINKRVWYYDANKKNELLNKEYVDEFGNTYEQYIG